jgi:hypothetical protein
MPPAQPPAKAPLIELDKTIVANITSDIGIFEKCIAIPGIKEIVKTLLIKLDSKYTLEQFEKNIEQIKELMKKPQVFINKFVLINQQFIDFYKLINDLLFQLKFNETIKSNSIDITDLKNKNFKEINEQYNKINKTTQPYQNFLKNNFFNHKTLMKQLYSKLPGLPLKDYEKWEINRSIITPITSDNDKLYLNVSIESNVFIHKETKYESDKIIDPVDSSIINQWKTDNMVNFKKTYKTIIENILLPIIDKIKKAKAALKEKTSFKIYIVEIYIKKLDEDLELCNILEHMLDRIYKCSEIDSTEPDFKKIRDTHKPKLKPIIDTIRKELLDIKYGLYLILMELEAS